MNKVVSTLGMPALLMAITSSGTTHAEQVAPAQSPGPTPDAPQLTPIIVTGEKTSRTLRDTASSVIATPGQALDQMPGVISSNDLMDHIPNIVSIEPGNEAPSVRGIDGTGPASGANAFFAGTRPRFNYQVDGRTLGFNEAQFQNTSLWDISQVEVYRGPQSTQQGRNSIAGAVVIRTADPTFDWEGKVRAAGGQQDNRIGSFALSGPLLDDVLAFRVAADYQSSTTAVDFTPYEQEPEPDRYRNETLRGKLLFTPTDNIRSLLTVGHSDGKAPQSERVIRPFAERTAQFANQPSFRSRNTYGVWDTQWTLSDAARVELNLSQTDFRTDRRATTGLGNLRIDGDETVFQPVLRLQSADHNISGFIGAYIFRTEQDEVIDLFGGGGFRDETKSNALFGEVNISLSDEYSLALGARYEEEKRQRAGVVGPMALDFNETYKEFLPKATLFWDLHDDWTAGLTIGRGYNGGGAGITFSPPFQAYTYSPEYVWNYEAFLRGELLDGRLNLTANVFYNDFEDMQLPFTLAANATVIRNAAEASTYGIEAGAHYRLVGDSEIFANLGLLQTKVDRYGDPTVQGNDLARAPAYSLDAGFIARPLPRLEISTSLRHTDAYYSDATNTPRGKINPYTVANAQAAYTVDGVRVYMTVENLFDNDSEVSVLTGATAANDSATLLQPRTVTAGIEYSF